MQKTLKAFCYSLYCTMLRVGHNDPWVVVPSGCSWIFGRRPSPGVILRSIHGVYMKFGTYSQHLVLKILHLILGLQSGNLNKKIHYRATIPLHVEIALICYGLGSRVLHTLYKCGF